jgi:NADH-quinone oxidoreductase subunit A
MYFDYLNVLVFAAIGLVFVFANMIVGSLIRPKRKNPEGLEVYECGEPTIGEAWIQFDIRYYTVALVYVIFAVEIAFLFPWALVLKEALANRGAAASSGIGLFALAEGVVFIAILVLGLAYVWAGGREESGRGGLGRPAVHQWNESNRERGARHGLDRAPIRRERPDHQGGLAAQLGASQQHLADDVRPGLLCDRDDGRGRRAP